MRKPKKIILATNNPNKVREVRDILSPFGYTVISQIEAGVHIEVEENGVSFYENAKIKALAAMRATGKLCVGDDSGLEIMSMDLRPGIFSARYGGTELSDKEKCQKILDELSGKTDRRARFECVAVCIFPNGREITTLGVLNGVISETMDGDGGFGYDPIFIPEGYRITLSRLSEEEKNAISHRGQAFRNLATKLTEI